MKKWMLTTYKISNTYNLFLKPFGEDIVSNSRLLKTQCEISSFYPSSWPILMILSIKFSRLLKLLRECAVAFGSHNARGISLCSCAWRIPDLHPKFCTLL